jgi:hypothetical protein
MTQIICLANSLKYGDRCISGIDPSTGKWLRPLSALEDGRITPEMRLIDGQEPELLDILEISIAETIPSNLDYERENRSLLPGAWKRVGKASAIDLLQYCGHTDYILHNAEKYVTVSYLKSLPYTERQTLQLVYVKEFSVRSKPRAKGGRSWKGSLTTGNGQQLTNAIITDPVLLDRLESGYLPQTPCLVTVSLSVPYRPSDSWEGDDPCWKLIVAAIELSYSNPK